MDNIYVRFVRFGGQLFRQTVGIPMGTDCAHNRLARKFNVSDRYIDDLISFNTKRFKEFISDIYPKELKISETTESISVAYYLLLLFTRDKNSNVTNKIYGKRDAFGFSLTRLNLGASC